MTLPSPPAGCIVLLATSSGATASDGSGRNGEFVGNVLAALRQPVTMHEAFMQVVCNVSEATGASGCRLFVQDLTVEFSFADVEPSRLASSKSATD